MTNKTEANWLKIRVKYRSMIKKMLEDVQKQNDIFE